MNDDASQPDSEDPAQPTRRVSLLSDAPSDVDEFAGGGHDGVASAIADLVTTEPGGRVIGLEGSWGAGKSTVVRLLRGRLAAHRDADAMPTCTVVFDAWSHQGDPLRRTFLEKLISDLQAQGWLAVKSAEAHTSGLAGKVSKSNTTSTPVLSVEGKVIAVAAALVPLGLAFFEHDFGDAYEVALHIVGCLLLGAPLLVVAGMWLLRRLGSWLRKGDAARRDWRDRLAALEPLRPFASSEQVETRTEGVEHAEPTSVEFEKIFTAVLSEALASERRLLIVLDNLDRVDAAEARSILATMQTFTRADQTTPRPWEQNLWTLIPYDTAGLDRLWRTMPDDDRSPATAETHALQSATATAFVEKIFQVRFETPPLVLSDWRAYLAKLLQTALDEDQADRSAVLRLRAAYPGGQPEGVVAQESPTPRQLKQFVDQVGGLRRAQPDLPLVDLAYYALLRADRVDVATGLLAGELRTRSCPIYSGQTPWGSRRAVLRDGPRDRPAAPHRAHDRTIPRVTRR